MTSPNPDQLRARAAAMRGQARMLDSCRLLRLHLRAGEDVWVGPTASAFLDELAESAHWIRIAVSQLRDAARALDVQAALAAPAVRVGGAIPAGASNTVGW